MIQRFPCRHTCPSGCIYRAKRAKDRDKHEKTGRQHRACSKSCEYYAFLNAPTMRHYTPDHFVVEQPQQQVASTSLAPDTPRAVSRTPSASSTSSRKRRREATPEGSEEKLARDKAERTKVIRGLKICCILDPSRATTSYEDALDNFSWIEVALKPEEFEEATNSGELDGYIFRHQLLAHTVMIYDWAYVAAFGLRNAGYTVRFQAWKDFSPLLLGNSSASVATTLREQGFDCILGGIDLSIRAPSAAANGERDAFLTLEAAFPIFPSPRGCADHGAKISFNETLEKISRDMGMSRPKTERLTDLKNPPHGLVLKREYSDAAHDVHVPNVQGMSVKSAVRRAAAFITKRTNANKNDTCSWLTQEFVPFISIAEIRFMCVGKVPIREVVTGVHPRNHPTEPGRMWCYEHADLLRTVSALQKLVDKGEELTELNAFDPIGGTLEKRIARERLHAFVMEFLDSLITLDGPNSSLCVFCRVDVSIFVDESKKVSLYVNEVERGITTSLYSNSGPSTAGHIGSDVAWPLARWITEEKLKLGIR